MISLIRYVMPLKEEKLKSDEGMGMMLKISLHVQLKHLKAVKVRKKRRAAICYDWLFPEAMRQLTANGAEILARVSAYMDPFGTAEPNSWWTIVNRCRALENIAYVIAANQGASLRNYPPFSWPGGSMIVDHDGRIVTQATPGDGEKIVTGPVDISMLRKERKTRLAHLMPAHLRTEAYPVYRGEVLPENSFSDNAGRTYSMNSDVIQRVKKKVFPG